MLFSRTTASFSAHNRYILPKPETQDQVNERVNGMGEKEFQMLVYAMLAGDASYGLTAYYSDGVRTPNSMSHIAIVKRLRKSLPELEAGFGDFWLGEIEAAHSRVLESVKEAEETKRLAMEYDL